MISINLEKQSASFVPGEFIEGRVQWRDLSDELEKIEIRLIWYTSGKGDRDVAIVSSQMDTSPGSEGDSKFKFLTPTRPFSFSGKLISLSWAIEVIVFPGMEAEQHELIISPTMKEILLQ